VFLVIAAATDSGVYGQSDPRKEVLGSQLRSSYLRVPRDTPFPPPSGNLSPAHAHSGLEKIISLRYVQGHSIYRSRYTCGPARDSVIMVTLIWHLSLGNRAVMPSDECAVEYGVNGNFYNERALKIGPVLCVNQ